jgi:predicted AlkP superfamily pyrophosphatase or phosphodiesterase
MLRRFRSRRTLTLELALAAALAVGAWLVFVKDDGDAPTAAQGAGLETADPVERACALDDEILTRLWRGHDPIRSEDVTMVPHEPNFIGTFDLLSHSGPWDYLQEVPLVLYGPGHITASGEPETRPANITDIYPTVGELLGITLPRRDGTVLHESLAQDLGTPPKVVVIVVWDGAGRGTLELWPDSWPVLQRLERAGTSYANATVGSSPSVTSAVHSSLGTGAWPRKHGVTGNDIRTQSGDLRVAFAGSAASDLRLTTFADEADAAFANESKVGMLAWRPWHLGMLSHGADSEGGDADELALIRYDGEVEIFGNARLYSMPSLLEDGARIDDHIDRLDRADGKFDGRWLGHDVALEGASSWTTYSNPAWAQLQGDLVIEMLAGGSYGVDNVPDLLFVNFKMTDLAGHQWAVDSQETAEVLAAQDAALGRIVDYLEREIGDFVVMLTADHGHSLSPSTTGAWPIIQSRLIDDLDAHFGAPEGSTLVQASAAFGLYLDRRLMTQIGTSPSEIAKFINNYTIQDNWGPQDLPAGYEDRGDERAFSAAFARAQMSTIMRCAFGSEKPPQGTGT